MYMLARLTSRSRCQDEMEHVRARVECGYILLLAGDLAMKSHLVTASAEDTPASTCLATLYQGLDMCENPLVRLDMGTYSPTTIREGHMYMFCWASLLDHAVKMNGKCAHTYGSPRTM